MASSVTKNVTKKQRGLQVFRIFYLRKRFLFDYSSCHGRTAYYTAPIKALVSEKFFDMVDILGRENVGMITGDSTINTEAPVICCTAEILANQALCEGPASKVGCVVMDEFHFYADPDRGWAQERKARDAAMAAMKVDGVEYEERLERLAEVTYPKPLEELLDRAFELYCQGVPWARDYFAEHNESRLDGDARSAAYLSIDESPEAEQHLWHVRQIFLDENADGDFRIEADVNLDATQEEGEVIFKNYRVGFVEDLAE